jgi:clan AA aspartic protease (TIGR02281 family)
VLLVPVIIGNQIVTMMVDTGAALTTLTPRAATQLGLDPSGFARRISIFAAGGATIELRVGQIRSLRVGAAELRDVDVGLLVLPEGVNFDGLLGINVLDRFRPTIDFRHATLILRPEPVR